MRREILQVNFAFLVMKTMRFYGWSWQETLNTPISAFWTCYSYIERLRADESISRLPEAGFSMMDEPSRRGLLESLQEQVGTVVVEKPVFDREGWRALQKISKA